MATGNFPLLLFPVPALAERSKLSGGGDSVHIPDITRQYARIAPQLTVLQHAFNTRRLKLQQSAPMESPELILVIEVAGTLDNFSNAVAKIPGLEWLVEWAEDEVESDEDFFIKGKEGKPLTGRLFLLASNQEALAQLLALWTRYQKDPSEKFDLGLNKFRNLFGQLRNIRHWSVEDRIDTDVRNYWQGCIDDGLQSIRFEIEAWYFVSQQKNDTAREEIIGLVQELGGKVLRHALIAEIAYHGLLVELPAAAVNRVLAGEILRTDAVCPDYVLPPQSTVDNRWGERSRCCRTSRGGWCF